MANKSIPTVQELSAASRVSMARELLSELLTQNGARLADYELVNDPSRQAVVLDGLPFTYAGGRLRMVIVCPVCGLEVPSAPIGRLADISSQTEFPTPMRHACLEA